MRAILTNPFSPVSLEVDIDPDKVFVEIFDGFEEVRQNLEPEKVIKPRIAQTSEGLELILEEKYTEGFLDKISMLDLAANPSVVPCISLDQRNIFDFWKTPNELGLVDGTEISLSTKVRAGGGVLPLNALYYHFDDLKKYLREKHKGLQCVFLYAPADKAFCNFMNENLAGEIVQRSKNIIIYAPIQDLFAANGADFLEWWENEYKDSSLISALDSIHHYLYCLPFTSVDDCIDKLCLTGSDLPCVVFFENDLADNVVVTITNTTDSQKLLRTLRKIFSIADNVNESPFGNKIKKLRKNFDKFEKENKERVSSFSIKINVSLLDVLGVSILDSIFKYIGK